MIGSRLSTGPSGTSALPSAGGFEIDRSERAGVGSGDTGCPLLLGMLETK